MHARSYKSLSSKNLEMCTDHHKYFWVMHKQVPLENGGKEQRNNMLFHMGMVENHIGDHLRLLVDLIRFSCMKH